MTAAPDQAIGRRDDEAPAGSWGVLLLMSGVSVLNVMDRQLMAILIEPIKRDLGVSDSAMGLLSGTSFALLHVAASVPIALWADRGVRRSIIAMGLAVWSGLTVLTGFARSFSEIFAIRVGVGIAEATGGGPPQALLSDSFPPERRATALSIFVMGGPIGSMIAFAVGGWLGDTIGWRAAFFVFGAPGLLLALLIRLFVREPRRGAFDKRSETPLGDASKSDAPDGSALAKVGAGESLRFLIGVPSIRNFVLASGLNTIGIYTILIWAVPYLGRVHALPASAAGARLAIASGLFTALGTLAGGPIADRLVARDVRWLAWMPAIASAFVFPFGLAFAFAPSGDLASALLAPASFMAGAQFGPIFSTVQTLAAPQMRALAASLITATNTILGLGLAPPLVGFLNDLGAETLGVEAIRYSIALMMTAHLAASGLFLHASTRLREDLVARERFLVS
jgi:predicted MFS family arabinose efflux permease